MKDKPLPDCTHWRAVDRAKFYTYLLEIDHVFEDMAEADLCPVPRCILEHDEYGSSCTTSIEDV